MMRKRFGKSSEKGFVLFYMAATMTGLLLFTGLAVDAGRAYVVKAALSKAVDGAALGAARMLNSGDPRSAAGRIFEQNFPDDSLGTTWVTDPADAGFFALSTDNATGVNTVTVTASAIVPTTFMRLANFNEVTVTSTGEATRRMVDLSLVLDVSSSIGGAWPAVRDAARAFVDGFSGDHDRMALVLYGNGASVAEQMTTARGFNKVQLKADIPNGLPGGSTAMVQGLYRGWDELRTVPNGQQSSLRVIVLFTDGASNSVPGNYDGTVKGLRTFDFPKNNPDPDGQTWDSPQIVGLFNTVSGAQSPSYSTTVPWNSATVLAGVPELPTNSTFGMQDHRSAGIPTSFPLQSNTLTVNGAAQSARRGLRNQLASGRYPAQVFNINNAARNVLEIIADRAREDEDGDYPIRIYTIGMGALVTMMLGTMPEQPQQILMRIANDKESQDFNEDQREGKYYYAQTAADVGPAFAALQSQIIRLTK
jgi:Flp pilus assembly protein TadG